MKQVDFQQRMSVSLKSVLPFWERRKQKKFAQGNSESLQALAFRLANISRTPPFSIEIKDAALEVGECKKIYREASPPKIKIDSEQEVIEALANVATLFQVYGKITDKEYEVLFFLLLTTRPAKLPAELEKQGVKVELPEAGLTPGAKQRFTSWQGSTSTRDLIARITAQPILLARLVKDPNPAIRAEAAKNENTHWRDVAEALIRLPQDVGIKNVTSPGGYDGLSFYPDAAVEIKGKIGYVNESLETAKNILLIHEKHRLRILEVVKMYNHLLYKALRDE